MIDLVLYVTLGAVVAGVVGYALGRFMIIRRVPWFRTGIIALVLDHMSRRAILVPVRAYGGDEYIGYLPRERVSITLADPSHIVPVVTSTGVKFSLIMAQSLYRVGVDNPRGVGIRAGVSIPHDQVVSVGLLKAALGLNEVNLKVLMNRLAQYDGEAKFEVRLPRGLTLAVTVDPMAFPEVVSNAMGSQTAAAFRAVVNVAEFAAGYDKFVDALLKLRGAVSSDWVRWVMIGFLIFIIMIILMNALPGVLPRLGI